MESDGIGLRFLARHLVTLDFPKHTMYLQRQSIGPLPDPRLKVTRMEALDSMSADVIREDAAAAHKELARIEQSSASELVKTVARKLAADLGKRTEIHPGRRAARSYKTCRWATPVRN